MAAVAHSEARTTTGKLVPIYREQDYPAQKKLRKLQSHPAF
jgi:hypothetical protein